MTAGKRDARVFQNLLHVPVFTERPVQREKRDVVTGPVERCEFNLRGIDTSHKVTSLRQSLCHRVTAFEADVPLSRCSAREDGDP